MYKCFNRIIRLSGVRNIVKVQSACYYGSNVNVIFDRKNTNQIFHPRLHDGYIFKPVLEVQKRLLTTSTQDQEDELDDLYSLITIEVKGHDKAVLQSYAKFMTSAATELDLKTNVFTPPKVFNRLTLNKAVFASRRAKVQYEIRTHYKVVEIKHLTGSTASVYLEYIQRNLPEGCAMKVTRHKLCQFPESIRNNKDMGVQVIRGTENEDLETITDSNSSKNVAQVNTDVAAAEIRETTSKDNEKHPSLN